MKRRRMILITQKLEPTSDADRQRNIARGMTLAEIEAAAGYFSNAD